MEPAWEEGVAERGGLGGGPSVASCRGDVHQGHQPAPEAEPQHRAGGAAQRDTAAIRAAADAVGRRCRGARHPGAAQGRADDAGHGGRRADRLGARPDHPARPGAGAATAVSAAGPIRPDDLSPRSTTRSRSPRSSDPSTMPSTSTRSDATRWATRPRWPWTSRTWSVPGRSTCWATRRPPRASWPIGCGYPGRRSATMGRRPGRHHE